MLRQLRHCPGSSLSPILLNVGSNREANSILSSADSSGGFTRFSGLPGPAHGLPTQESGIPSLCGSSRRGRASARGTCSSAKASTSSAARPSYVYIRRSETQVSLNIPGFRPGFPSWQGIRVGQGLPLPPPDRSNGRGSAGPSPRPLHHCSCRDVSLADVLSCIRELKNIDLGQIIIADYLIISDVIFSSFT